MGVLVPIIDIAAQYNKALGRCFDSDIFDVFEESLGYQPDEEFTSTFRITLDLETEEGRADAEHVRQELRARWPDQAEVLIAQLDEDEWDTSFFVDYF